MKYTLTKYDYAYLFPLMTPYEIKEEFGARAVSPRAIYKSLEKISDKTAKAEREKIVNKILDARQITDSADKTKKYVEEALEEARLILVADIWERVNAFEDRFPN